MSVDVFLIRHGETPWNTKEVFRGRIDIPLSEEGLMQAEKTGDALVSCTLGAVYTSPQKRSFETARIIGEKQNIPPIPLTGFMDVSFGEWEGKQLKEVKETYPDLYQKWRENPEKVGFPEGESLDDVRERSCKELERLVAQHNGETVVIVTHRVVLKVLICWLLGLDNSRFWQIKQDTCTINLFQYREGRYIAALLNDTCHLRDKAGISGIRDF